MSWQQIGTKWALKEVTENKIEISNLGTLLEPILSYLIQNCWRDIWIYIERKKHRFSVLVDNIFHATNFFNWSKKGKIREKILFNNSLILLSFFFNKNTYFPIIELAFKESPFHLQVQTILSKLYFLARSLWNIKYLLK